MQITKWMFSFSGYILKRVGHMNVFFVMFLVYALIFFLFSIIENPDYVLSVEILSGIAFALFYSEAISYAHLLTPAGAKGTFQGVVGTALTGIKFSYEYFGHFNILYIIHIIIYFVRPFVYCNK